MSGSKSISNRVLMIEALCSSSFNKKNLASANDTVLLERLLSSSENIFDAQDAGTTFRFLTAYLALKKGEWILTGSERMKQRPVGDLVNALRHLGAEISYSEKENFPPLKITGGKITGDYVRVNANISSQFISALLMIAPCLKKGLTIALEGDVVSESYIEMTLQVMKYFGIHYSQNGNAISIESQEYKPQDIFIESDWSAASYYYEMAAFADAVDIKLHGLMENSFQGDQAIAGFMKDLGVETIYDEHKIIISKIKPPVRNKLILPDFPLSLTSFPDLAPALFVTAAGRSAKISFSGLEHLKYKESNREEALRSELGKCGIRLLKTNGIISVSGSFSATHPRFSTYQDHRIAMSLAPLAMLCDAVDIEDPLVVNKSYPAFWNDLKTIGFEVNQQA